MTISGKVTQPTSDTEMFSELSLNCSMEWKCQKSQKSSDAQ